MEAHCIVRMLGAPGWRSQLSIQLLISAQSWSQGHESEPHIGPTLKKKKRKQRKKRKMLILIFSQHIMPFVIEQI